MNTLHTLAWAAAFTLIGAAASAQVGPGPGPGMGPGMGMHGAGPGASAPAMGSGPHGMRGGRAGAGYTYGWSMMSPKERSEHQQRMRSMTSYEECKAYVEQHHAEMVERAKAQGGKPPVQPRRDACAGLKR